MRAHGHSCVFVLGGNRVSDGLLVQEGIHWRKHASCTAPNKVLRLECPQRYAEHNKQSLYI